MKEGETNLVTRQNLYSRYLTFNERVCEVDGGREVVEALRADSFLTNDMYVGLALLMDWAEGDYELMGEDEVELIDAMWEGIAYIASGDPIYLYGVEEERRELIEGLAFSLLGEDLENANEGL